MAKPISKTPTLKGKDADRFVSKMVETTKRNMNKSEKEFLRLISNC